MPCILADSGADLIIYGMGELPLVDLCKTIDQHLLHGRESRFALPNNLIV